MIEDITKQIINNPLFLKLQGVVENGPYHDHEDVYSHLIKTKDIAVQQLQGDFIINPDAKKAFLSFINTSISGLKRADVMILTALLHDIGKILIVKEGEQTHPLLVTNQSGITSCPGHEYWGSTIVNEVVKELTLPKEVVEYITKVIRLHDSFTVEYFQAKSEWPFELLLNDVKSRAEGLYKEAMFNQYCDCFTAKPYQQAKEMIMKIFNEPKFYQEREYLIP